MHVAQISPEKEKVLEQIMSLVIELTSQLTELLHGRTDVYLISAERQNLPFHFTSPESTTIASNALSLITVLNLTNVP